MYGQPWTAKAAPKRLLRKLDPLGIISSCWEVQQAWLRQPVKLMHRQQDFFKQLIDINLQTYQRFLGQNPIDAVAVSEYDERFQDKIWFENPVSDFIKEYYLLCTRWLEDSIFEAPQVDYKTRRRAAFWVRQYLNTMSPTNFFPLNPKAISRFYETGGKSVWKGLGLFAEDLQQQNIKMVDAKDFYVGRNLATTEGMVVYRNKLIELIQYAAKTDKVHAIPIVIAPPWINKYYILDLTPKKSLVNYLIQQGYTVFMISWKNPDYSMRRTTFYDYALKGIYEAVLAATHICQSDKVHAVGYCIGGTALSILLAWLNVKQPEQNPIAHWTLLCSLTDFSNPGDIDIFIDELMINHIENMMAVTGYLDSRMMENTFRLLRSNSLIWHYYVAQYLYGEAPTAFDVLYWNTDGTRMPQAMYSFYLRELYLKNNLVKNNALKMKGIPLSLKNIQQPLYAVGTEQDHITPWKETFKTCAYIAATTRYVLATSGHILGVLTPPVDPPKRRYWVGDATQWMDPMAWLEAQPKLLGSWWEDWIGWLEACCGPLVEPPTLGDEKYQSLEPAPGSYVREG